MKELDIPTLVQVINDCFENSRNNQAFNEEQRSQWFIKGSEYKQLLVRAVGKKMTEGLDPKVQDANQRLSEISERLKDVQETLKNYNKTIQDLTTLAEIIGQIIDLASLVLPLRSMMSNPAPFAAQLARESFPLNPLEPTEGSVGSDPDKPFLSASKLLVKGQGTIPEFLAMPTATRNIIIPAYASSSGAAGFNPPPLPFESFVGRDDRVRISDTDNKPWRMICSLSIQGPRGRFQGTGWFAGPKTIITAGHCIYQESQMGGWATQIEVSPGQDGNNFPYSSVVSKKFEVPEEWVASRGTNPDFDYGVIFLDQPLGERTGWFSVAIPDNNKLDGARVNLAGYPADPAGGFGTYQLFHADLASDIGDSRFFYAIDTYGGQSGAPVWIELDDNGNRQVVGIHTYGIGGSFKLNSATRITPTILTDIKQWLNK
jgi:V8-like Glu-specific endopeptidase